MIDTITSDSGVKYDVVDVIHRDHPFFRWQYVLQKFSQSIWECNHSFDSSLLSNPPIAVCSKCGFQKKESATCKSCLGKKKLSVYTNQVVSPDFIGDKPYHTWEDDIQYVNCSRCKGDWLEPKVESEKQDFWKILLDFIELHKSISYQEAKHFLSSNWYL